MPAKAVLLAAEDAINKGDLDRGESLLDSLPTDLKEDELEFQAGNLWLELEAWEDARHRFRRALAIRPDDPESTYWAGVASERLGEEDEAISLWLRVRELDLGWERPTWRLSAEAFEAVVEAALSELPERARELLQEIPIFHEEYPEADLIREGVDPRSLGLFMGASMPDSDTLQLHSIHLFERNIESVCESPKEMREQIRITLIHETGHFFGLEEEDLEALGLG